MNQFVTQVEGQASGGEKNIAQGKSNAGGGKETHKKIQAQSSNC